MDYEELQKDLKRLMVERGVYEHPLEFPIIIATMILGFYLIWLFFW